MIQLYLGLCRTDAMASKKVCEVFMTIFPPLAAGYVVTSVTESEIVLCGQATYVGTSVTAFSISIPKADQLHAKSIIFFSNSRTFSAAQVCSLFSSAVLDKEGRIVGLSVLFKSNHD